MAKESLTIGVVAPAARIEPELAARVEALAATLFPDAPPTLRVHPQCFQSAGHFAGTDAERSAAFLDYANDPDVDAIWFARGGYGSCRLSDGLFAALNDAARAKTYMGYSDTGSLLGRLYKEGIGTVVHGPMPADLNRGDGGHDPAPARPTADAGRDAVARALRFLVSRDAAALEPTAAGGDKTAAFNLTILAHLVGTPWAPDLTDHVVMLEDVSEYLYRIDRAFFTVTSSPLVRKAKGIKLGRVSDVLENDTADFVFSEEEIAKTWCARSGIPYLGRADIGHDAANKVVVFGGAARA